MLVIRDRWKNRWHQREEQEVPENSGQKTVGHRKARGGSLQSCGILQISCMGIK
jgi:hypothetical protein